MASAPPIQNIPFNLSSFIQITKANLPLMNLVPGDALTLGVIEKLPENHYLMALKGVTIAAKTDAPLAAGDKIQVKVQSVQPQLILQVVDASRQASDGKAAAGSLPKGVDPGAMIQVLTRAPQGAGGQKADGGPMLQLVPGQTLTVTVQEKLPGNQYLMAVRNVSITASSDIPLQAGEKFQVKVQSIGPQILLSMMDVSKSSADTKVNERLIQWRLNPGALTGLLARTAEFSQTLKTVSLPAGFSGKDSDVLIKLLSNLVFSPRTKGNPLFVKNFASQIGLMLERDLTALAARKSVDGGGMQPLAENLKASLLKLSDALGRMLADPAKLNAATADKLQNLASFTADALKTVEARQAVNVVYQQNENGLYLQIPLALGEAYRQADIFIRPDDKNAPESRRYSSCSVTIFLDLDYLGEMAVDASVSEGRIRCLIKCEKDETRELLNASAGKLEDALGAIGYGVGRIECVKTSDLAAQRAEFIHQQILGATDLVNSFA